MGDYQVDPGNKLPFVPKKWPQFRATLTATIGSFSVGTVLGWTSPALPDLSLSGDLGDLSKDQLSWIASLAIFGALLSGPFAGFLVDRIGRKMTMHILPLPFIFGWGLMAFADTISVMYVGRFITGFCGGAFTVVVPAYISETVEETMRGLLGSLMVLMLVTGILFAFIMGALLSWFWLTLVTGTVPLLLFIGLFFIPETPRYLLLKDKENIAKKSLQWLRGATSFYDVDVEYIRIKSGLERKREESKSLKALLVPSVIKPTSICLSLMFFQQLGGINGVTMYTVDIFKSAGSQINPNMASIIIGIVQVVFVFSSMMLVDRIGRKTILLVSDIIMAVSLAALGFYFYLKEQKHEVIVEQFGWVPLVCLILYIVAYSGGAGPIPWIFLAELIPPHVKGVASSMVTSLYWILAFFATKTFPDMISFLHESGCYWCFSLICAGGALFTYFLVPETKGKSSEEIQALFGETIASEAQIVQCSDLLETDDNRNESKHHMNGRNGVIV